MKQQSYDISASFLVPAYDLPVIKTAEGYELKSHFLGTERGQMAQGSILIDVWLVRANKENPLKSMIESLQAEFSSYVEQLDMLARVDPTNVNKKRTLEYGKNVFKNLVVQAQNSVYHKQPDAGFLKFSRCYLGSSEFKKFNPDVKEYLFLRYNER